MAFVAAGALWKRMRSSGVVELQDDRVFVTSKKYCRNWLSVDATALLQRNMSVKVSSPLNRRKVFVSFPDFLLLLVQVKETSEIQEHIQTDKIGRVVPIVPRDPSKIKVVEAIVPRAN